MISIRGLCFSHLRKTKVLFVTPEKLPVFFSSSEYNYLYNNKRVFVFPETYCIGPHRYVHTQSRLTIQCHFTIIFYKYLDNIYKKEGLNFSSTLTTAPTTHQRDTCSYPSTKDSTEQKGNSSGSSLGISPFQPYPKKPLRISSIHK